MKYRRVLVKLSGGAFAGTADASFARDAIDHLAQEVLTVANQGVQVAIMVGGGNIFRGRIADEWGIERVEADYIGMMGTVINSLVLRGALRARNNAEVRVMTAIPMAMVAEPYIRLRAIKHLQKGYIVIFAAGTGQPFVTTDYPAVQRAIEIRADAILAAKQGIDGVYTADPRQCPSARRFRTLPYDEIIRRGIDVMDQAAFILARDYQLPIHVFDAAQAGLLERICSGESIGTYIGPGVEVELAD